jgi:hypothetical protein
VDQGVLTIGVALLSALFGYLVWAWQNRLRPWIAPLEFSGSLRARDRYEVPSSLSLATSKSKVVPNVPAANATMEDIDTSATVAKVYLARTKDSAAVVKKAIDDLGSATQAADKIDAVRRFIRDSGVSHTLVSMMAMHAIAPPPYDPATPQQIPMLYDAQRDGGCYLFEFMHTTVSMGERLEKNPFAKTKVEAFAELVRHLDIPALHQIAIELLPLLHEETELATMIAEKATAILEDHTRWACHLSITNFGTTPFIVFSEGAELLVQDKGTVPITLPCILTHKDEDGDWVPANEVQVIPPGTTQTLGIVTAQAQKDMKHGHLVRAVFEKGSGRAQILLRVHGLATIGRRTLRSQATAFAEPDSDLGASKQT